MYYIFKKLIYVFLFLIFLDISFSIYRQYRRKTTYKQAKDYSKKVDKKLLVIGDPKSGFWNRNIQAAYGCGDVCLDIVGCDECLISIKGDILVELKKMNTNEYVIFESCVLEYINQDNLKETLDQIDRVSGGDYFQVRIKPYIFPTIMNKSIMMGKFAEND